MWICAALLLTAKGADFSGGDTFYALAAMDDIKRCQETLKNLDRLIKLSEQLKELTSQRYVANRADHDVAMATIIAGRDYDKLIAWRDRIAGRIQYDRVALEGSGITGWEAGRQAAKDAARDGRDSSTEAARQTGADAARNAHGMANCKDGH